MSTASILALPGSLRLNVPITKPWRMAGSLMVADSAALVLAVAISVLGKALFTGSLEIGPYLRLAAFLPVFLAGYAAAGLYSSLALVVPEEVRRTTACSALMFIFLSAITVSIRGATTHVKPTVFVAIGLTAVLAPLLRSATRHRFCRYDWWGYPAVIFGTAATARELVRAMLQNPGQGLKPVAIARRASDPHERILGIPVVSGSELLQDARLQKRAYAVIATDAGPEARAALDAYRERFSRILVIPDNYPGIANLLVTPRAVGRFLGLEVCQHALIPHKRFMKRVLDFVLAFLVALVVLPLLVVIAILVKLDSRGPIFFSQNRIGRGSKTFGAWKFRSMATNAAELLELHLASDPSVRFEWERTQKLRQDPRITRVGAFLRKSSLDELPQLWNVLKGDMSLVGPRPIVQSEIVRYGDRFGAYARVPGGITGLWQVSGRNDTTYEERVALDAYYVRNWSVWLDFYILFRTVGTVLLRKGAY
jgi:Undecaprenyl-phosphate galactose phosphotransferase WbaP